MQVVKDATGREWPVAITVAGLERVKDGTGFDLCSLIKGEPLQDFYHDLTLAVRVGYWLCQPFADAKKSPATISPRAFRVIRLRRCRSRSWTSCLVFSRASGGNSSPR